MNASKHYSVKSLTKEDDAKVLKVLAKNPNWKLKHARELVARQKFMQKIGIKL